MPTEKKQYSKISEAMERAEAAFPKFMAKNFARILQQIEMLWGEREVVNYFDLLLLDNREGRQGFPQEALREIALVKHVHDILFPSLEFNPYDPFSDAGVIPLPTGGVPRRPAASAIEFTAAPAPDAARAAPVRGNWPKVRTQHDLAEIAELRYSRKNLYEQQGKPIGEILIHYGFTDERTMRIALRMRERYEHQGKTIGQTLAEIGIVGQEDLVCALCVQSGIIMADLLAIPIPPETIKLIPSDKAREKQVVPIGVYHNTLYLAVADPFAFNGKSFFTVLTGFKVEPVYAPRHEIVNRLNMYGFGRGGY